MPRPVTDLDHKSLQATVHTPPSFRDDIPLKVFTHGFQDRTKPDPVAGETGERGAKFIKSWQDYHKTGFWGDGSDVGVMLINWSFWARGPPTRYDTAARNSIDVGNFVGRCLAALTRWTRLKVRKSFTCGNRGFSGATNKGHLYYSGQN